MENKEFYIKQSACFNNLAEYLDSVLTTYGNIHHPVALRARGSAIDGAHEGYDEVKSSSAKNGVDIGTRKNFKKVLKSQIDKALKENRKEYALYIKSISNFLEFYYRRF